MYTGIHFSSSTTYDSITLGLELYLYKNTKNIDGSYIPLLSKRTRGGKTDMYFSYYHNLTF